MKIFLNGFMGSGKSYWGRVWSSVSGLSYFDLDTVIEEREGLRVAELFEKKGEAYFREKEKEFLREFAGRDNFILSCGGGTPCLNNNMDWMNAQGITIYLEATPQYIAGMISGEIDKRPVLKNVKPQDLISFIEKKISEREPFYRSARHILPVTTLDKETIQHIIQQHSHE